MLQQSPTFNYNLASSSCQDLHPFHTGIILTLPNKILEALFPQGLRTHGKNNNFSEFWSNSILSSSLRWNRPPRPQWLLNFDIKEGLRNTLHEDLSCAWGRRRTKKFFTWLVCFVNYKNWTNHIERSFALLRPHVRRNFSCTLSFSSTKNVQSLTSCKGLVHYGGNLRYYAKAHRIGQCPNQISLPMHGCW